jgi:hypothetical protein
LGKILINKTSPEKYIFHNNLKKIKRSNRVIITFSTNLHQDVDFGGGLVPWFDIIPAAMLLILAAIRISLKLFYFCNNKILALQRNYN